MITVETIRTILDDYTARFPDEAAMAQAHRAGIEAAEGEPSSRKTSPGHFTSSALVMNADFTKTLLISHRLLGVWIQPGGHLEAEDDSIAGCAAREAEEETSVTGLQRLFPDMGEVPFFIDSHPIPANPNKNEPPHTHFDFRYAFIADELAPLQHEEAALHGVAWVAIANMEADSSVRASVEKLLTLVK